MKWTPGPWDAHVKERIACGCLAISSKNHPIAKVYKGEWGDEYPAIRLTDSSIARQYEAYIEMVSYGTIDEEEAAANARLIAAAPAMYEALEAYVYNSTPHNQEIQMRALEVLQQARGES